MKNSSFSFLSSNQVNTVSVTIWKPEEKPKAILQLAHGMTEYIERYDEFARFMAENGILVVGNDHIGHGKSVDSEAEWGYFAKKNGDACLVEDIHTITNRMKSQYPNLPFYLLGHSMGSFLVRRYIMDYGNEIDGVIIMGTGNQPLSMVLGGKVLIKMQSLWKGERYRSPLIEKMMFGSYNNRIKDAKTSNDWLTTDEAIVEKYNRDPACTFVFTLNGFLNLVNTILYIMKKKNINKIPKDLRILLTSGEEDPVGNYGKDVEALYRQMKAAGMKHTELKLYKGCRHEILNEVTRQTVYQDLLKWLLAL